MHDSCGGRALRNFSGCNRVDTADLKDAKTLLEELSNSAIAHSREWLFFWSEFGSEGRSAMNR
jgi:hypothetical protein